MTSLRNIVPAVVLTTAPILSAAHDVLGWLGW